MLFSFLLSLALPALGVSALATAATEASGGVDADVHKTLKVARLHGGPLKIDADWDKPAWRAVAPTTLTLYMGERPEHFPTVAFRVLYDDKNLYVIFRVEDRYVRAVATKDGGTVWKDSCVEFFFTPGDDPGLGYFNFETNCIGSRWWHHHPAAGGDIGLAAEELAQAEVAHTLSGEIEPERPGPQTWVVEYRFPIEILTKHTKIVPPAPGVKWRGNFYKCGDLTSHPHFLHWSRIVKPKPAFHSPEFFGTIEFVE